MFKRMCELNEFILRKMGTKRIKIRKQLCLNLEKTLYEINKYKTSLE